MWLTCEDPADMTTKWGQFHGYCFEVPATATPAITPPLPLKEIIYKNRMKISYLHLLLFLVSFLSAYGNDIVVTWGDGDRGGYSSGVVSVSYTHLTLPTNREV